MPNFAIHSPDGRVKLHITADNGKIFYEVSKDDIVVAGRAPLGLVLPDCDLSEGLSVQGEKYDEINETYSIPAFKKSVCVNHANTIALTVQKDGRSFLVEGRAYDDGAAVRLVLNGTGTGAIDHETTAFAVPDAADSIYGMKWLCSYEDHYHPIPKEDLYQNIYAFPMLVHVNAKLWALYAEAAVFGDFGGSNLCSTPENPQLLRVMKATDKLTDIVSELPMKTPWRTVITGDLNAITNSNLLENLNPPSIVEDPSFIKPGICAWSWMSEKTSPRDPERMRAYVDFAASMHWPYSVVDGGWPGHVDIPELVKYADTKKIKIWIWSHSRALRDPAVVDETFKLWSSWGVVGLKIDFFESDSQERVKQYGMIAEYAAKYRLMINFHGCMKPSGTSRVWPHVLSYEAVQGGEYLANFSTFTPGGPDAAHNCTLPFTRNVMGPMDYTPVCYKSYITGTTDTHQTALPIVFASYIGHIGEGIDAVTGHPCVPFLQKLHTSWDESVLLEGYPANYVTMARRSGEDWYVGGICARRPRNSTIKLDFLGAGEYEAELYCDDISDMRPTDTANGAMGPMTPEIVTELEAMHSRPCQHQHDVHLVKVEKLVLHKGDTLTVPESANGGYALYLTSKK